MDELKRIFRNFNKSSRSPRWRGAAFVRTTRIIKENIGMKICVVGNAASGKTLLSLRLGLLLQAPVFHVDSLQFDVSLNIRPHQETRVELQRIQDLPTWIIDGYGPLDDLQERFEKSDVIVLIDIPLWQNYLWGSWRFMTLLWKPRKELPFGHNELQWRHIQKFYMGLKKVHNLMRPELLRILQQEHLKPKCLIIRSRSQFKKMMVQGLATGLI